MDKDIIVIGGGPGGYVAAIRAAQLGASVCLIEKDALGGTCLNRGCIPTKALYRNAEILNTLKNIDEFGIKVDNYSFSVEKIQQRKNGVVNQLVNGIAQLIKANNVELINGTAEFVDKNTVKVSLSDGGSKEISAKNIIIATGSEPTLPPIPGSKLDGVVTSDQLLQFDKVPDRLIIVGGGVIGMEFACIFNAMGSNVTVVEFLPSILAPVDSDLTKRLNVSLKKKGIDILTSTKVTAIEKNGGALLVSVEGKKGEIQIEADTVLIAVGRKPVFEGLDIDRIGIEYGKSGILVDERLRTNIDNIYAIGDVNGKIMLAHAASHQGIAAVEDIMGQVSTHEAPTPNCIFIFPEISSVGITEDEAKLKAIEYKTSKFLFGANGKALALGEGEGMVKVISDMNGTLLGVHIMGPHASDLIHEATLAITQKLNVEDIINMVHAHPTLSEAFAEACAGIVNEAIHMVPTKRS